MMPSPARQLDLFDRPKLISRWKNDGPWPWTATNYWSPRDPNVRWFDGVGWCNSEVRWCERCQVWHPTDGIDGTVAGYRHTAAAAA